MFELVTRKALASAGAAALLLSACDPVGTGTLSVTVNGEEGTQRGYPSTELADGWSISFDSYLVSLADLRPAGRDGGVASALETPVVVDLHAGAPQVATLEGLPTGRLRLDYALLPPTAATVVPAGVDAALVEEMRAGGWTYLLQGVATKPSRPAVRFKLGLPAPVRMEDCTSGVDGTQGVVIPASSTAEAELTLHAEHLFYDRLGTHAGVQLRFEALAAAAGEDALLTFEELASQSVLAPRGFDGAAADRCGRHPGALRPRRFLGADARCLRAALGAAIRRIWTAAASARLSSPEGCLLRLDDASDTTLARGLRLRPRAPETRPLPSDVSRSAPCATSPFPHPR